MKNRDVYEITNYEFSLMLKEFLNNKPFFCVRLGLLIPQYSYSHVETPKPELSGYKIFVFKEGQNHIRKIAYDTKTGKYFRCSGDEVCNYAGEISGKELNFVKNKAVNIEEKFDSFYKKGRMLSSGK